MATATSPNYKPSYHRLNKPPQETEEVVPRQEALFDGIWEAFKPSKGRRNGLLRLNRGRRCRRPRLRVAGLRRLLTKKAAAARAAVSVSLDKVLRRLKEGRPHLGELFAGNYMFMQVTPSPTLHYLEKTFLPVTAAKNHYHRSPVLPPTPSLIRFNVPKLLLHSHN
ncbi:uncharacterized protein LOC122010792 [Zingiber officinale]|uniref:uncharacterized protein LOC122010792 n=1 Tax=Zingiber officinale TaxID=94328 RepID=UPI001C4C88CB|nr:uncharacterized protein LOC122010792 [Zingiber officinale]